MVMLDEVYFFVCFGDLITFSVLVLRHNKTNAYNLHCIHTHTQCEIYHIFLVYLLQQQQQLTL